MTAAVPGDWVWGPRTAEARKGWPERFFCPDVKIQKDDPSYVYMPCRGYSANLAVFDIDCKCIGWIDTRTLGFENAREWMASVKFPPDVP